MLISGSGAFSPVTITSSAHSSNIRTGAALHQLPSVISKPKVIVTNGTQVMLNGPSGLTALANGATHVEVKKDPSSQNPGTAFNYCLLCEDFCLACILCALLVRYF